MEVGEPLLSERIRINGFETEATFSAGGQLRWADRRLDFDKEVLGFSVEELNLNIRAVVEREPGICSSAGTSTLVRKTFILVLLSNDSIRLRTRKLRLSGFTRPKSLFILVNPIGGKKSASKIFTSDVKPLLDDANIHYTMRETEYQLHAKELAGS